MKILIIGGGRTVSFLCDSFVSKGHCVTLINRDPAECQRLALVLSALVICGDGSDPGVLEEAGARGADAVFALTPHDPDNLIACQAAAIGFGVTRVVALANDPENVEVFEKLGVSAFSTTRIIGSLVEQRTSLDWITNLLPIVEGRVNVTEIVLEASAPAAGKRLRDLTMPDNSLIAVVMRDGTPMVPRGNSDLKAGDRLVLITLPENHGTVLRMLAGVNV